MALHAGRPRITASGKVELECGPCSRGERPVVVAVEPEREVVIPHRPRRRIAALGAAVGMVAVVAWVGESASERMPAATTAVADEQDVELVPEAAAIAEPAPAPVIEAPEVVAPVFVPPPMPEVDGVALDVTFPVLDEWVHPVPGSPDVIPQKSSRFFGARRDHVVRRECGGGHCGVDLEGTRGQTLVAVSWGKIARIQPDDVGSGGRYVRIEHPGHVFTTYFHLDAIAPGLEQGAEIEAGEPVGALGRSGIRVSMPHLHFALEVPSAKHPDGAVHFIDPAPFLARAEVLPRDAVPTIADALAEEYTPPADPDAALDDDPSPAVN